MKKLALAFATLALLATGCLSDDPEATEPDPTATEVPATIALVHPDSTAGGSDGADSDGTGSDGAGGPGGVATETLTDDGEPRTVTMVVAAALSQEEAAGCNRDELLIQMDVELTVAHGDIVGLGSGVANWTPNGRCGDTDYGGQRTVEGPTVEIIGSVGGDGWTLSFDFDDVTEAFFTGGDVYASGPLLDHIAQHATGSNVDGTLISFFVSHDQVDNEETMYFDVQTPTDAGSWISGDIGVGFGSQPGEVAAGF